MKVAWKNLVRHRLKYIEPNPQTFSLHNVLLLDSASISRLSSIGISNAENTQPLLEMRLIDTATFQLKEFPDERNVTYAILSHRWEEGEVLFNNMVSHDALQKAKTMKGFYKVEKGCLRRHSVCLGRYLLHIVMSPLRIMPYRKMYICRQKWWLCKMMSCGPFSVPSYLVSCCF